MEISWTEVTNEGVLRKVNEQRKLMKTIWRRKARWVRHVLRGEGLLHETIKGRFEGRRPRGRKRAMMLVDVRQGRSYEQMKRIAQRRNDRRRLIGAGPVGRQTT